MSRLFCMVITVLLGLSVLAQEKVEGAEAPKPADPANEATHPSREDAERFSYYLGYRNGKTLAANAKQKPANTSAFLRGVSVTLDLEKSQAADQDNADYEKGVETGTQIVLFAKKKFTHLDVRKIVAGLSDSLANKKPAFTAEELSASVRVCSKFLKAPPTKKYLMLDKQAPKWDVGPWHQLPEGKASLDISDYQGKVLYIYCFQSWCPGCHKRGFPTLQQVSKKYKDDDSVDFVVFQTVFEDRKDTPVNTFENLKNIAKKFDLSMPFAQSGNREDRSKIMGAYKTRGTPWTIIVDKKGVIRYGAFHISPDDAAKLIEELKAAE